MKTKLENYKVQDLSTEEMMSINAGGAAFKWLGRVFGHFNNTMTAAVDNGYTHAGLFY
mgnify:CR=1 FL=1